MELISIITPLYNSERYIEQTIISIRNQTYENWELIVVDDASKDRSVEIVEQYIALDDRIRLFKQEKNMVHPSFARNIGVKNAKGTYIAFLDSDDLWCPNKLKIQIDFMAQHPECHIVCSSYEKINELGETHNRIVRAPMKVGFNELLKTNSIGNLTAMYNQKVLGKYYQDPVVHEDYVMWLKMLKTGEYAYGIHDVTAMYRVHSQSISSSKRKALKAQWYIYRKVLHFGFFRSTYYFACYAYLGFKKYII